MVDGDSREFFFALLEFGWTKFARVVLQTHKLSLLNVLVTIIQKDATEAYDKVDHAAAVFILKSRGFGPALLSSGRLQIFGYSTLSGSRRWASE